jgi:hypothetical protein
MAHRTEQWVAVPHYCSVLDLSKSIHLTVIHNHDRREAGRRASVRQLHREEVRQLSTETRFAAQQDVEAQPTASGSPSSRIVQRQSFLSRRTRRTSSLRPCP